MVKHERPFRLGFLVHDVSRLRRTIVDKALRPSGITRSQWWVLSNMVAAGNEGVMQTELAKNLDIGKVTLGGLIDRLELGGLVRRQGDPEDRRAKRVIVTPKGARLLADIQSIAEQVDEEIMAGISKGDVARAEAVLVKMKQQLIAMDAVPNSATSRGHDGHA